MLCGDVGACCQEPFVETGQCAGLTPWSVCRRLGERGRMAVRKSWLTALQRLSCGAGTQTGDSRFAIPVSRPFVRRRKPAASKNLLPDKLGELVATVGSLSTETGRGFEEEMSPLAPKALGMLSLHDLGMGNTSQQNVLRGLWRTPSLWPLCVAEPRPGCVCRRTACARVRAAAAWAPRRWPDRRCADGLCQRKIGQAVADQVDGSARDCQGDQHRAQSPGATLLLWKMCITTVGPCGAHRP